jgi:hypothetical protein
MRFIPAVSRALWAKAGAVESACPVAREARSLRGLRLFPRLVLTPLRRISRVHREGRLFSYLSSAFPRCYYRPRFSNSIIRSTNSNAIRIWIAVCLPASGHGGEEESEVEEVQNGGEVALPELLTSQHRQDLVDIGAVRRLLRLQIVHGVGTGSEWARSMLVAVVDYAFYLAEFFRIQIGAECKPATSFRDRYAAALRKKLR